MEVTETQYLIVTCNNSKRMKIMKKLSALIMFTLLATVGYYIGNAVAQNKNAQDAQIGRAHV